MRLVTATLVVLGALLGAEASVLGSDGKVGFTENPIARIVTLIKGMKMEIIKDGKMEQQLFDKFQCWTERSVKESRKTIGESEDTLDKMEQDINRLASEIASSKEEITHLEGEIKANEQSQKDATEMRKKEQDSFEEEVANDVAKTGALEKTLDILMGNKAGGKKDKEASLSQNMAIVMRSVVSDESLADSDKQMMASFAKAPAQFFQSSAGRVKAYQSQAGPIIGIMKGMLLATSADLQQRTLTEIKAVAAYQNLMKNLREAHENLNNQLSNEQESLAKAESDMADSKTTQANTKKLLEETEAFMKSTVEAGKEKAKEWATRSQLRLEELKNIDQGIHILSDISDPKEQAFNKAGAGSFLQVKTENARDRATRELAEVAMEYGSQSVTRVVAAAKLSTGNWKEAMWKIVEMIDRMVVNHKEQATEDMKMRKQCQRDLTEAAAQMKQAKVEKARAEAAAEANKKKQEELAAEASALDAKSAQDAAELKEMNENSLDAQKKMRSDLGAREHAIDTIKHAIEVIGGSCASFVQEAGDGDDKPIKEGQYANDKKKAPKAEFSDSKKHCQSTQGLISIMQMVVKDLGAEVRELKTELKENQSETATQGAELRGAIESQTETSAELNGQEAVANQEEIRQAKLGADKGDAHDAAEKKKGALTTQCDDFINEDKFSQRQADRETEVEALNYAKTVLTTGASGGGFLQIRSVKQH